MPSPTVAHVDDGVVLVQLEIARQRIKSGPQAQALTDLSKPDIDWVSIGRGFSVHSRRATTVSGFCEAMRAALQRCGPSLIEAVL